MTWRHPTPEDFDHARDERKHWPRPGDDVPLCAQAAPVATATEIALIVRNLANVADGAALIEQYARTRASEGVLEGVAKASQRIIEAIDAPLSRKEPADAQA
jgi:hypothetical protein